MRRYFKPTLIISILFVFLFHNVGMVKADEPTPETQEIQNPVVIYLAGLTGLGTQEILNLQNTGYGLGQIAKAIYLVELSGAGDLETVMAEAKEVGWGNLYKSWGNDPSEIKGLGWLFKTEGKPEKVGPPDHANNDKDKIKDTAPPEQANNDKDKEEKIKEDKDKDKDKD